MLHWNYLAYTQPNLQSLITPLNKKKRVYRKQALQWLVSGGEYAENKYASVWLLIRIIQNFVGD